MSSGDFFISVEVEKKIFETFAAFFGIFFGGGGSSRRPRGGKLINFYSPYSRNDSDQNW